jgi:hypothetical protein
VLNFLDRRGRKLYFDSSRCFYDEGNLWLLRRIYGRTFGAISLIFSTAKPVLGILVLLVLEFL